MKKFAVLSVVFCMVAVFSIGCATTGKGASDAELIQQRIAEGIAAIKAKNFDAFDGMVSDNFSSGAVGDKQDLMDYLKNADDMGFLDDIEIDLADAETVIEGETATVSPVTASGSFGSLGLEFTGVKEKGVWVVSGVEPGF